MRQNRLGKYYNYLRIVPAVLVLAYLFGGTNFDLSMMNISIPLPDGVTFVGGSATSGGTYGDGKVSWTVPTVAAGGTFQVKYKVKIN